MPQLGELEKRVVLGRRASCRFGDIKQRSYAEVFLSMLARCWSNYALLQIGLELVRLVFCGYVLAREKEGADRY